MNIEEIFDELGVEYVHAGQHHHARPGWIQLKICPFCHSDKYHLGWNISQGYSFCWKCRYHHADQLLVALGLPRQQAREFRHTNTLPPPEKRERSRVSLREPRGRGPLLRSHQEYLVQRGYDPKEIEDIWKIEGIGIHSRLSWRIYIPITQKGIRVSWTTRAIGDRVAQRYLSASAEQEAVNHKEVVYGLDICSHSIVIVEGPLDAWKIGPGAGALFGTAFTSAQVRQLVSIPNRFICMDSSPDAQVAARDLANQLSCFPGVTQNLVIDAKDPGEASAKEIRLIRRIAKIG